MITLSNQVTKYKDSTALLHTLEDNIQTNLINLSERIECSKIEHSEFGPVNELAKLLPTFEAQFKKHEEITDAFRNKEAEDYHRAMTTAKKTLETYTQGTRNRLVQEEVKNAETRNEERSLLCDEIVEKMFDDD